MSVASSDIRRPHWRVLYVRMPLPVTSLLEEQGYLPARSLETRVNKQYGDRLPSAQQDFSLLIRLADNDVAKVKGNCGMACVRIGWHLEKEV